MSPHRTQRPWQGQTEKPAEQHIPQYDPGCYLCPGNTRAGGHKNPDYASTFVFDNDYAALLPDTLPARIDRQGIIVAETERGVCRVVCFSPRHDLTISNMNPSDLRKVVDVWAEQYQDLGSRTWVNYVQIFENRGAMMGASNPHPHGQIWANATIPNIPAREQQSLTGFASSHSRCLLCEYLALENKAADRIVCANRNFTALVPFWATWPFEILILSHTHLGSIAELDGDARDDLTDILRRVTARYDNLFQVSFPYSMGFHQKPTDGAEHPECHFHAHFFPPLLRSASVRKFMVGYEMLAGPQRDITPEASAERLRQSLEVPLQA